MGGLVTGSLRTRKPGFCPEGNEELFCNLGKVISFAMWDALVRAEGWPVCDQQEAGLSEGKCCHNAFTREAAAVSGLQETQDVKTRGWVGLGPLASERKGLGSCHVTQCRF